MELRLKELLKEKGVTTYQLAEYLGVTQPTVSSRMNGNPDIKWLFRVAEYLKVDISELFSPKGSDISGYLELGGSIRKISSVSDLEEVLRKAREKGGEVEPKNDGE